MYVRRVPPNHTGQSEVLKNPTSVVNILPSVAPTDENTPLRSRYAGQDVYSLTDPIASTECQCQQANHGQIQEGWATEYTMEFGTRWVFNKVFNYGCDRVINHLRHGTGQKD